jgi:penicillin-binding protein 1A
MKNRSRRGRKKKPSRFRIIKYILQFGFLFVLLAIVGVGAASLYQVSQRLPTIEELGLSSSATRIYSADGVLLARLFRENRDYVHLKDIPENLQNATIAIEDERFYSHSGLDMRGIARALVTNVQRGHLGQGASTITQQLARNAYDLGKQKTFNRKVQEAIVSLRLERKYTKKEILEGYLNEVFYGANSYGAQAAARQYFGKPAKDMTLAECALLAGLPQRPTEYNPYNNASAAKTRRNIVLARMAHLGYITDAEAKKAEKAPVHLAWQRATQANNWKAPYFVDYVIRELEKRYEPDQIYRGGLEVHTSLLYSMQKDANEAVHNGLADAIRRGRVQNKIQAALTCVDPHNGYVRAMVGGKNWNDSKFNRATNNKRQPGSTFKLFVYTAALNEGWNQWRTVNDSPKSWRQPNGKWWTPSNDNNRFSGPITLRRAVANSVNMVAIKVADAVGMKNVIAVARSLGLEGPLAPGLATAIGAGGASTLEMAAAYGAFAVKGQYIKPIPITLVKDRNGNILEKANPEPKQVVKPGVANEMDEMLRAVVTEGTARNVGNAVSDSFGKTGTTQDNRDAWFVGFTPQLATAVWIGNDDNSPMNRAYGGVTCGPIWIEFMQHALKINPKDRPDFTNTSPAASGDSNTVRSDAPVGADGMVSLKICPDSNLIATNHCPHWRTRRFSPEDAPTGACNLHPGTPLSGSGEGTTRRRNRRTDARSPDTPHVADVSHASQPEETQPPSATERAAPESAPQEAVAASTSERLTTGRADRPAAARPEKPANPPPVRRAAERRAPTAATFVTLCADSGLRATSACPRTITRRLTASTPSGYCRLHGR